VSIIKFSPNHAEIRRRFFKKVGGPAGNLSIPLDGFFFFGTSRIALSLRTSRGKCAQRAAPGSSSIIDSLITLDINGKENGEMAAKVRAAAIEKFPTGLGGNSAGSLRYRERHKVAWR